ncbi:MAG: hypothetical protein ACRELF_15335 [Gemmataceae bacterium]
MEAVKQRRQRRMLTESELLSIVESTDTELLRADAQLAAIGRQVVDGIFPPSMFLELVKGGSYTASTVQVEGKPAFVLVHCRNELGWLLIEGAVALGNHSLEFLFDGAEALARHFGAPVVAFTTKLTALYRYATAQGYESIGVIVCKKNP